MSRFVTVAPNVRLGVLDWGGAGKTMVLLSGLDDVARVYDDFAFQWTDFYRHRHHAPWIRVIEQTLKRLRRSDPS